MKLISFFLILFSLDKAISLSKLEESTFDSIYFLEKSHKHRHQLKPISSLITNNLPSLTLPLPNFLAITQRWDYNLLLTQLTDIWYQLLLHEKKDVSQTALRAYLEIFVKHFEKCDEDKDNLLSITEFVNCMKTDPVLSKIPLPALPNLVSTEAAFHAEIFFILDMNLTKTLNFADFLYIRAVAHSWSFCSIPNPFIEEEAWECVVTFLTNIKNDRATLRSIFYLAVRLANNTSNRNLDFTTTLLALQSITTFSKVEGKNLLITTKDLFLKALETNVLPNRFQKSIIETMFQVINSKNSNTNLFSDHIDIQTFLFIDIFLRIFVHPSPNKPFFLNSAEFEESILHPLFPKLITNELEKVPQVKIDSSDYEQQEVLKTSKYFVETDFLFKFKEAKVSITYNNANTIKPTIQNIFNLLDIDQDGFIDFTAFLDFAEISFIFSSLDDLNKGHILAGKLHKSFTTFSAFPAISSSTKQKASSFSLLSQDLYLTIFDSLTFFFYDSVADNLNRKDDKLTETDMRRFLNTLNLSQVPNGDLNKCIRKSLLPMYDYKCVFLTSIKLTAKFWEEVRDQLLLKTNQQTLKNTEFVNPWRGIDKANSLSDLIKIELLKI